MVFHVGYDIDSGKVCAFDTDTLNISHFETESRLDFNIQVEKVLHSIKSKINGKLGCLGVSFDSRNYKTREEIIEYGYKYGFEKVELIDPLTSHFIGISLHTDYQPQNQDYFWVIRRERRSFFGKPKLYCHVWIKENDKARKQRDFPAEVNSVEESSFADLILQSSYKPKIIFFLHDIYDTKAVENAKKAFPQCIILTGENKASAEIALVKARIMADDPIYKAWDILNRKIYFKIGDKVIMDIKEYQLSLPVTKTVKFTKTDASDTLSVVVNYLPVKKYALPKNDSFDVTLHIDANEILTIEFYKDGKKIDDPQLMPTENEMLDKPAEPETKVEKILEKNTLKEQKNTYVLPSKITTSNEIDAVGIDLGTSRCCAAVNRKNGIETVALDYKGERLLPSFVAYDEEHEKHGQVVVDRLRNYPKSTIFDSKRIIGRNFGDIEIDSLWPFKILNENGVVRMGVATPRGDKYFNPEEIAASLLKHIKEKCEI